jgi:energy-coupling factor transporter ATP-binding protein EcfA2
MSEETNINQEAKDLENAAISGTGSANVTVIHNYYYSKEISVAPVNLAVVPSDETLPCPYRGLYHFDTKDAEFYFGREVFVEEIFQATQTRNFVPVIGASGSGKSSVVLAGLVPKLQQEGRWQFTYFRPGEDPFYSLASALVPLYTGEELNDTDRMLQAKTLADSLRDEKTSISLSNIFVQIRQKHPNDRVLLIADQFEEVYTLCTDESIRHRFLDLLLNSPLFQSLSPMVLVSTMRARFLENALSCPPFANLLRNNVKIIESMGRKELTAVIEKPPAKLGITFEAGLVERILDDVKNEPGNLPLLESALTFLWEKRTGKQLSHETYQSIGKVQGALTSHADKQYSKFTETEKLQVQRIFIQLVRPNEETGYTRRLARLDEIGQENWSLVTRLANQRLVVTSRNDVSKTKTVELVHEALIREWKQLREWMSNNRDFRTWQESLRSAQKQWETTKKGENKEDDGALLRGALLQQAETWLQDRPTEISEAERLFIELSTELRDRSEQSRKRVNQGLIGFSMITLVSTGIAISGWINADRQSHRASAEQSSASALALQKLDKSPIDALMFAMEGGQELEGLVGKDTPLEAYPTMHPVLALQTILDKIRLLNQVDTFQKGVNSIAFNTDQKLMATAGGDGKVKLWTGDGTKRYIEIQAYPADTKINSVRFSSDSVNLATAGENGAAKV